MIRNKNIVKIFIITIIFFFPLLSVNAAVLSLNSDSVEYGLEDTISVNITVNIDEEEECINTVEAYIVFLPEIIKAVDFSSGESILSLWIARPGKEDMDEINSNGIIHFSGGIPGGYCGKLPGDPGESNIIGKLIFKVNDNIDKTQTAEIDFSEETKVLLNDGLGTSAKITLNGVDFIINKDLAEKENNWEKLIKEDNIPPESFVIELYKDENIFNGQYFIFFSTTDKQTGVDHYEVLEIKPNQLLEQSAKKSFFDKLLRRKSPALEWKKAEIPYLLEDQSLGSIIRVKAIDKAGNERIGEYIPSKDVYEKPKTSNMLYYMILLIIAIVVLLILSIVKLIFRKKINKENNNTDKIIGKAEDTLPVKDKNQDGVNYKNNDKSE